MTTFQEEQVSTLVYLEDEPLIFSKLFWLLLWQMGNTEWPDILVHTCCLQLLSQYPIQFHIWPRFLIFWRNIFFCSEEILLIVELTLSQNGSPRSCTSSGLWMFSSNSVWDACVVLTWKMIKHESYLVNYLIFPDLLLMPCNQLLTFKDSMQTNQLYNQVCSVPSGLGQLTP